MQHSPYSSPPPCPMCVACTNKSHSNPNPAPPVPISPSPQSPNTNTNVYVSNLPKTVSDEWLQAEFGQFGLITSAKVMSDHGKSKGYAFVQYTEPEMAAEAVAQMNGCYVGENCINVKFADRDKDRGISNRPSNNLYVSNLPLHFGVAELSDLFGCFGPVTSLVVLTEPNSENSRGVGLVRFYTVEDASVAIQMLNGVVLEGHNRPLEVKYAENQDEKVQRKSAKRYKKRSSRRREYDQEAGLNGEIPACGSIASTNSMVSETSTTSSSSSVGETNTTLLVWGLPPGVDEIFVYKLMAPYGAVLDVILDKSRNSASVHFRYYSDANDALDQLQGALVQDHQIQLAIHNPTTFNNGNYQNNHTCSP